MRKNTPQKSKKGKRSEWRKSVDDKTKDRLQNSRFFLKISKEIGKAWRKSLARAKRASLTRRACEAREKKRIFSVSSQSRSLFSASFQTFCLTLART